MKYALPFIFNLHIYTRCYTPLSWNFLKNTFQMSNPSLAEQTLLTKEKNMIQEGLVFCPLLINLDPRIFTNSVNNPHNIFQPDVTIVDKEQMYCQIW